MSYIKRNINKNSLKALKPQNRLQSDLPKKRINITIDYDIYLLLKETGNISGTIEQLAKNCFDNLSNNESANDSQIMAKLTEIVNRIDNKEAGYKSGYAKKLIDDLKNLIP